MLETSSICEPIVWVVSSRSLNRTSTSEIEELISSTRSKIVLPTPVCETNIEAMSNLDPLLGLSCSRENVCSRLVPLVDLTSTLSEPSLKSNLSSGITCQERIRYDGFEARLIKISSAQRPLTTSLEIDFTLVKRLINFDTSAFNILTVGLSSNRHKSRNTTSRKYFWKSGFCELNCIIENVP